MKPTRNYWLAYDTDSTAFGRANYYSCSRRDIYTTPFLMLQIIIPFYAVTITGIVSCWYNKRCTIKYSAVIYYGTPVLPVSEMHFSCESKRQPCLPILIYIAIISLSKGIWL